jgi:sialidase-1
LEDELVIRTLVVLVALVTTAATRAGEPLLEKRDLFEANTGGYALYRIPGLVATKKGTLLAYCEARKNSRSDWGSIDILMRRSTDGGKTWDPPRKIVSPPKDATKNPVALAQKLARPGEVTINNPVAIADWRTGAVHFLYCVEYARCFYQRSDDDGETFSGPVEITSAFERFRPEYDWKVLATGPGHGIQLSNGRLLVPIWLSTGTGGHAHRPSAVSVVYSDDHGKTWDRGDIVVADPRPANPSETAAVELADGRVMLNIRHESEPRVRGVSISRDGVTGWSQMRLDGALPEPVCFGSLVRLSKRPVGDKDRILFVNPHNPTGRERRNLTVKLSEDEGRTWPVSRSVEPGTSGYSDLAVGPGGVIFCLYERGTAGRESTGLPSLCLARFNLEWLAEGRAPQPIEGARRR